MPLTIADWIAYIEDYLGGRGCPLPNQKVVNILLNQTKHALKNVPNPDNITVRSLLRRGCDQFLYELEREEMARPLQIQYGQMF